MFDKCNKKDIGEKYDVQITLPKSIIPQLYTHDDNLSSAPNTDYKSLRSNSLQAFTPFVIHLNSLKTLEILKIAVIVLP